MLYPAWMKPEHILSHRNEPVTKDKYFWMQLRWDTSDHTDTTYMGCSEQNNHTDPTGVAITKVEKWWLVLVVGLTYPGRGSLK